MNEPELEVVFAGHASCLNGSIGLHLSHVCEYFAEPRLFELKLLANNEDYSFGAFEEWPHHVVDPAGFGAMEEFCSSRLQFGFKNIQSGLHGIDSFGWDSRN